MENSPEYKKIMNCYRRSGKIGVIQPKDPEHARNLAKIIAKKIRSGKNHG
jgi:hypothetical protein